MAAAHNLPCPRSINNLLDIIVSEESIEPVCTYLRPQKLSLKGGPPRQSPSSVLATHPRHSLPDFPV